MRPKCGTLGHSDMSITFRQITRQNFKECIGLKVREDQRFVASNVYSIAQSKIEPEYVPLAIYNDETMVGFIMYSINHDREELYLCRFMIDEKYQGKGYGKQSLALLRKIAEGTPGIRIIELSTKQDNSHGIKVYEKAGFIDTGVLDDGEEVFVLELGPRKE
jgi:diamine N-acetyltransferase